MFSGFASNDDLTPAQRMAATRAANAAAKAQKDEEEKARLAALSPEELKEAIQLKTLLASTIFSSVTLSTNEKALQAVDMLLSTPIVMPNGEKELLMYSGIFPAVLEKVAAEWTKLRKKPEQIKQTCDFLQPYVTGIYQPELKLHLRDGAVDASPGHTKDEKDELAKKFNDPVIIQAFIQKAVTILASAKADIRTELSEKEEFYYALAAQKYNKKRGDLTAYNLPCDRYPQEMVTGSNIYYRAPYLYALPKAAVELAAAFKAVVKYKKEKDYHSIAGSLILNPMFWKEDNGALYIADNPLIGQNIYGRKDCPGSQEVYTQLSNIIAPCWEIDASSDTITLSQVKRALPALLNGLFGDLKTGEEKEAISKALYALYMQRFLTKFENQEKTLKESVRSLTEQCERATAEYNTIAAIPNRSKLQALSLIQKEGEVEGLRDSLIDCTESHQRAEQRFVALQSKDQATIDNLDIVSLYRGRQKSLVDLSRIVIQIVQAREIAVFSAEISTPRTQKIQELSEREVAIDKILLDADAEVEKFLKEVTAKADEAHKEKLRGRDETFQLSEEKKAEFLECRARILTTPQLHSKSFEEKAIQINRCIDVSLGNVVVIPSEAKQEIGILSRQLSESKQSHQMAENDNDEALSFGLEITQKLIEVTQQSKRQKKRIEELERKLGRGERSEKRTHVEKLMDTKSSGLQADER